MIYSKKRKIFLLLKQQRVDEMVIVLLQLKQTTLQD